VSQVHQGRSETTSETSKTTATTEVIPLDDANAMLKAMTAAPMTEDEAFAPSANVGDTPPLPTVDEKQKAEESRRKRIPRATITALSDFPAVIPEDQDRSILVRGRWLERGCGSFLISTAGTGKSIWATQFALSAFHGVEFSGLHPNGKFRSWIIQTEDSDTRIAIDRDDLLKKLQADRPDLDWQEALRGTKFLEFPGCTGARFIEALENELYQQTLAFFGDGTKEEPPDCIILNPLFGFIGGDIIRDAGAFFRGGRIGGVETVGLQTVLKQYRVASLIVHHTGKPPTSKELKDWLTSPMPEYQSCGSSEITNWGRSFITMMKVPKVSGIVTLTAGKNGGALGWPEVAGLPRMFLAHGLETSVSGSGKAHYWRKPDDDEIPNLGDFTPSNGPAEEEDPSIEKNIAHTVIREAAKAISMTVAAKRVHEAIKKHRKAVKAKKRSFALTAAKTLIEDCEADGLLVFRQTPKGGGRMVGTPEQIEAWEQSLELLPTKTGGTL